MNIYRIFAVTFIVLLFFLSVFIPSNSAKAQLNEDYNRLSFVLHGGATIGNTGSGFKFFRSSFNKFVDTSINTGVGIQYAVTPVWSIHAGYNYTNVDATDNSFDTDINTISFKNWINLNQLFQLRQRNNFINPYLTAGLGIDFYKFKSDEGDISNIDASFNAGAGVLFKLNDRLDFFTQYEYQIGNNLLDNNGGGFGADVLGMATGGIRINLGNKNKKHLSWKPVPISLTQEEYDALKEQSISKTEQIPALETVSSRLDNVREEFNNYRLETEEKLSDLDSRVEQLEETINKLISENSDLNQEIENLKEECGCIKKAADILPGHYVQIFAASELQNAINVRRDAISRLSNKLSSPSEQVLITSRRNYYEVLIGVFEKISETDEILEVMIQVHRDAFVKTIPRPPHLYEAYKDLKRVNLNRD